jgi:hypothetical protein
LGAVAVAVLAFVTLALRESGAGRGRASGHALAPETRGRAGTALAATRVSPLAPSVALSPPVAAIRPGAPLARPADAVPEPAPVADPTHGSAEPGVASSRASDPGELSRIRRGLASDDAKTRLESLRAARDLRSRDLEADVALLLRTETCVPVRRVATQILAQGDVTANESVLRSLKVDPDILVQLNASFGLARGGDEVEQLCLLAFCETARGVAPDLVPLVATALEDPALRSRAVIARFQQLADDPTVAPEARERAQQVLKAKQGS